MTRAITFITILLALASAARAAPALKLEAVLDRTELQPGATARVAVITEVPTGFHAQSSAPLDKFLIPFRVTAGDDKRIQAGAPVYPDGEIKQYFGVGKMSVYGGQFTTIVPIRISTDAPPGPIEIKLSVRSQICTDAGNCLAPTTQTVTISTSIIAAGQPVTYTRADLFPPITDTPPLSDRSVVDAPPPAASDEPTRGLAAMLGLGLLVGLIFNVMPCVLPVLPLKIMGFYEASHHRRGRSLMLGVMFSLGVIGLFLAMAGIVLLSKSLFGAQTQWGQWFSVGWVVWGMAILLSALGISMIGLFTVQLPSAFYGLNFRHDTLSGNVGWGMLTALLSTPCTAPMFAGVMAYAITQPLPIGFVVMSSVGVGMSLPYLLLSGFPEVARRFPRTGPAPALIKEAMAIPMFATAVWLVGPRLVGDPDHWWLVAGVAVIGAALLMARAYNLFKTNRGRIVTGIIALVVAGAGVTLALEMTGQLDGTAADRKLWTEYSDEALAAAQTSGRPVVVKFTASWCATCQYIDRTVFADSATRDQLAKAGAVLIKADLTYEDAVGWKQLNRLGHTGIPLTAIYTPQRKDPVLLDSIYDSATLLKNLAP